MDNGQTVPQAKEDCLIVQEMTHYSPAEGRTIREVSVYECITLPDGSRERGELLQRHTFVNGERVSSEQFAKMTWDDFYKKYSSPHFTPAPPLH